MRSVVAGRIGRRQMLIAAGAALVGTTLPRAVVRAQPALRTLSSVASLGYDPHHSPLGFLALSLARDGKTMLTSGIDGDAATLWDLTTKRPIRSFEFSRVVGAYIIGDGKTGVIASRLTKVVLRDLVKGTFLRTITSNAEIDAVAVAPDGRSVAIAEGRTLSLWDFGSRTRIRGRENPGQGTVAQLAFSPDGKSLACAHLDALRSYNPASLALLAEWPLWSSFGDLAFSADSRRIFVGGGERVTVFDIAGKRQIAQIDQLGPERSFFSGMAVFRNGQMFAAGDRDGHLLIGSLAGRDFIARSPDPPIMAQRVAVSPDEKLAYVGTASGEILVFDISEVPSPS